MIITVRVVSIFFGQPVQAQNFRTGPWWTAGVIAERMGPLTYLVQVDSGVFWRRHIDHLHPAPDKLSEPDGTVAPNLSVQPDLPGHLNSFQLSILNNLRLSNKVLNKLFLKDNIHKGRTVDLPLGIIVSLIFVVIVMLYVIVRVEM